MNNFISDSFNDFKKVVHTCYKQLNEGSKKRREKAGLDTEGFCDTPMIAAWKMDCMAQEVMQQLWTDQNESLQVAIELV